MIYIFYIFRVYVFFTILFTLISLPLAGSVFYRASKKKGHKHIWMYFVPGLCFYPLFILTEREFKLFGFIKIDNRKKIALYYIISNNVLLLLCLISKCLLFTEAGPLALYANIHFISLILFILQFTAFRIKAYYDLFLTCKLDRGTLALAILSVIFPFVLVLLAYHLEKTAGWFFKKNQPAND